MLDRIKNLHKGRQAELLGSRYLKAKGLSVVSRNYRSKSGEIDIIAKDGNTTVFVEVRYRAGQHFGLAQETVDARKQAKLAKTALHYMHNHPGSHNAPMRFDVLAINGDLATNNINWIRDAFEF